MNNDSYMNKLQNHEMTMQIAHKCQTHKNHENEQDFRKFVNL